MQYTEIRHANQEHSRRTYKSKITQQPAPGTDSSYTTRSTILEPNTLQLTQWREQVPIATPNQQRKELKFISYTIKFITTINKTKRGDAI